jgi:hypothetical protein
LTSYHPSHPPRPAEAPNQTALGLAAGAYTAEDHIAVFTSVDHNDNGVVCFKDVAALNGGAGDASGWQYLYNLVDDNASVPGS